MTVAEERRGPERQMGDENFQLSRFSRTLNVLVLVQKNYLKNSKSAGEGVSFSFQMAGQVLCSRQFARPLIFIFLILMLRATSGCTLHFPLFYTPLAHHPRLLL